MTEDENGSRVRGLRKLQNTLGHCFEDRDLLDLAITHSSVSTSSDGGKRSNERLEFLGDRVLGLVIADMLYRTFCNEDEGFLARRHAALVRREALVTVAQRLCLGDYVRMSRGEASAGARGNVGLLADACEAIIGAIYLDAGLDVAAKFVHRNWQPLTEEQGAPPKDAKTELQEWAQGRGVALPEYREISRKGPPHAPIFSIEVSVHGKSPVTAQGPSKRVAEQAAAEAMLNQVRTEYDR